MKQSVCRWLAVPMLALALAAPSWAAKTIEGKVISVADGDTLTLVDANREKVKVRLGQIDAPESAMPYGGKAKQALADKVFGKQVSIAVETKDRYGRVVGVVWLQGKEINLQLLEEGMAWWYKDYSSDKRYQVAQEQARQAKKGLWEQANPQAPWEWRKQQRSGQFVPNSSAKTDPAIPPLVKTPPAANGTADCRKTRCSEMRDCAEAKAVLQQCRVPSLDKDGDGVPCEALCR